MLFALAAAASSFGLVVDIVGFLCLYAVPTTLHILALPYALSVSRACAIHTSLLWSTCYVIFDVSALAVPLLSRTFARILLMPLIACLPILHFMGIIYVPLANIACMPVGGTRLTKMTKSAFVEIYEWALQFSVPVLAIAEAVATAIMIRRATRHSRSTGKLLRITMYICLAIAYALAMRTLVVLIFSQREIGIAYALLSAFACLFSVALTNFLVLFISPLEIFLLLSYIVYCTYMATSQIRGESKSIYQTALVTAINLVTGYPAALLSLLPTRWFFATAYKVLSIAACTGALAGTRGQAEKGSAVGNLAFNVFFKPLLVTYFTYLLLLKFDSMRDITALSRHLSAVSAVTSYIIILLFRFVK